MSPFLRYCLALIDEDIGARSILHDAKNLLRDVSHTLDLAQPLDRIARRRLDVLAAGVRDTSDLLGVLLEALAPARRQRGDEGCDFAAAAKEIARLCGPEPRIAIDDATTTVLLVREPELSAIMLGLIVSAVDAGASAITLRGIDRKRSTKSSVRIIETDDGRPRRLSLKEHIPTMRSIDVGLYVAVQLIRQNGGDLSMTGGRGASFTATLDLPAAAGGGAIASRPQHT